MASPPLALPDNGLRLIDDRIGRWNLFPHALIRYGDVIAVSAGGTALAAAGLTTHLTHSWWIAFGITAMVVAGSRVYRHQPDCR
ncbi:hypothetical protein ACWGUP_28290 [Streptomyces diastaticus]|uniref:hypothetical protein n=1 Tax=Streptomyces TaxID=1883 RepID=UPI0027814E85|nr:hypothetical protein [Streptomyces sp. DSM 41037]MDQ0297558.1 hypothetical protein [Streptomyces sp. DSM 41037]